MKLPIFNSSEEKPLDVLIEDGGFCGIFRRIGVVGDSLASGAMQIVSNEGINSFYDMYEYSWGQYMARKVGCHVENFSRGGMTAQMFCDSFGRDCGAFYSRERACQCYIIALGVNDANSGLEMGNADDICIDSCFNNKKTVAGYYGQIIQRLKIIQPDAKFFLVTAPRGTKGKDSTYEWHDEFRKVIYDISDKFQNTYVIDLRKYAVKYNTDFRNMFFLEGHMNAAGYLLTSKIIISYMDYIIRHNLEDFKKVALIGTQYYK